MNVRHCRATTALTRRSMIERDPISRARDFISVMPHDPIQREQRAGNLAPVRLQPMSGKRPIRACYR